MDFQPTRPASAGRSLALNGDSDIPNPVASTKPIKLPSYTDNENVEMGNTGVSSRPTTTANGAESLPNPDMVIIRGPVTHINNRAIRAGRVL
jgi:hypothetical protein